MGDLPLVSVLIPAYNQPHYLQIALQSALNQTYPNIEIIVCDDSTNIGVLSMIGPYLNRYPQIRYFKNESVLFLQNPQRCLTFASGEYINFLMHDDVFLPQKIEVMMSYMMQRTDVKLVTSFRQTIGVDGQPVPSLISTNKLFDQTTVVEGRALGDYALTNGMNVIGEPTTALFRKSDLNEVFGVYHGRQYICLNDMAAWLRLLSMGKAVYIPETLSQFRLHENQNSRNASIVATAIEEWMELIMASRNDGFLSSAGLLRAALYTQRMNLREILSYPAFESYRDKIESVLHRIEHVLRQF